MNSGWLTPYHAAVLPLHLVLADVAGPAFLVLLAALAGFVFLVVAVAVVSLEAWAFWYVLRPRVVTALRDAFLVNCASFVVGIPLALVVGDLPYPIVLTLLVGFVVSVLVEGGLLRWIHRRGTWASRQLWRAALVANLASYLLLAVLATLAVNLD